MAFATFTRISDSQQLKIGDGAGGGHAAKSFVIDYPGLFGWQRQRAYAGGNQGQAIPIGTALAQKQFTIVIQCTDETGADQSAILDYFDDDGFFTLVDAQYNIGGVAFTVVSIDPAFFQGRDVISVTCQAEKGKIGTTPYNNFQSYSLAAGASGTQSVSRTPTRRSTYAVSFDTASPVAYNLFTPWLSGLVQGSSQQVMGELTNAATLTRWFFDSARGFSIMQGLPTSGSGSILWTALPLGMGALFTSSATFTVPANRTVILTIGYSALPAATTLRVWELGL